MTKLPETRRCGYCRRPLPPAHELGRPSLYCRRSHRQRAYEARRHAAERRLTDDLVVVSQGQLDRLHDRLYELEAALDDVDMDLKGTNSATAYKTAFAHIYQAADGLRGALIEPAVR